LAASHPKEGKEGKEGVARGCVGPMSFRRSPGAASERLVDSLNFNFPAKVPPPPPP